MSEFMCKGATMAGGEVPDRIKYGGPEVPVRITK